jgi:spore coat polysaccharide biosynthesis predicted glycosyltransferase SpsG
LRDGAPSRIGGRSSVLVCFGGSDPFGVTARLGPTLATDRRWETEIVVGSGYAGPGVEAATLRRDPPDLPRLLAGCDVAVLGAGTMKFEAACLGRPAILVAAADDQLEIGREFAATGAAVWLGDGRVVGPAALNEAVAALLADEPGRTAMGRRAIEVVDGRGADRVAAAILSLA